MEDVRPVKILTEPKVYLVGRSELAEDGLQTFLDDAVLAWPTPTEGVTGAERLVEFAGRACYMSFAQPGAKKSYSQTNEAYIGNTIGRLSDGSFRDGPAHGALMEHVTWNFAVRGASRGFTHEQVRHRVGVAYSQLSTRYCNFEMLDVDEGQWEPAFCIPPLAQLSERTKTHFAQKLAEARHNYVEALRNIEEDLKSTPEFMANLQPYSKRERRRMLRKAARGAARELLPVGSEAILIMSLNARNIWNISYLRASPLAEAVIRSIYVQILKIMEKEMPSLFTGIEYVPVWDGTQAARLPREKL